MGALQSLEDQLAGLFKDLPALPKGAKDLLVSWWPYLALILGALQLLAAWGLYQLANWSSAYLDSLNRLSQYTTGTSVGYSDTDKMIIYGGVALLAVNAVIFFMAYSPLTKKAKRGWDLLFLASVINVVYGIVQIFMSGRGIGSFLVSLVGSAIGFYLLFQIRERYSASKTAKKA
ncbi:MAG: hypothetical protein AAB395_04015 [Patescibacteria group bacterium]